MNKFKAVFLDRDGVINEAIVRANKPYSPSSLAELTISADASMILCQLKERGYVLIGATNQPDVARGAVDQSAIAAIHDYLIAQLPLDAIYACFHDDKDQCLCRKPKAGMLFEAAAEFSIDLKQSFMIGDRWKDITAGKTAGCKTIFIDYGYAEKQPDTSDYKVKSLREAAQIILERGA